MLKQLLRQGFHALAYSILGLVLNCLFSLVFVLGSLSFLFAAPFILLPQEWSRIKRLFYGLMTFTLLSCLLLICPLCLFYFIAIDPLKMFVMGLLDGRKKPLDDFLDNFWKSWKKSVQGLIIEATKDLLENLLSRNDEYRDYGFEESDFDYQPYYDNLYDEPQKQCLFDSSTIQILQDNATEANGLRPAQERKNANCPLSSDEWAEAKNLSQLKGKEKLKRALNRYKDLYQRLEALDTAMENRGARIHEDLVDLDDECISMTPISKPVLLQKLYEKNKTLLKVVPKSTFITDETNMKAWFEPHESPTHPVVRDSILDPEPYKNRTTFFRWHFYQGTSQELREAAEKVRILCEEAVESEPGCLSWLPL